MAGRPGEGGGLPSRLPRGAPRRRDVGPPPSIGHPPGCVAHSGRKREPRPSRNREEARLRPRRPPVLLRAQGVEFEGTAQGDDEQQPADQAADERGGDDLSGHGRQAAVLIAAVLAVLLTVTAPRLEDAQVGAAVEGARLAGEAVLLVRTVGAALLVVAAVGGRVAQAAAPLAGVLVRGAGGAALLVPAAGAVPPAVAALRLREAALLARVLRVAPAAAPARLLPREAVALHLVGGIEAVAGAAGAGVVGHGEAALGGLEAHGPVVAAVGERLQQAVSALTQALVHLHVVVVAQPQLQLQQHAPRVLRVHQPCAVQVRGPAGCTEQVWGGEGAVEAAQPPAAGQVGTAGLVGAVAAVLSAVAAPLGRQAACGARPAAGEGTPRAQAAWRLRGRRRAVALIRAVATLVHGVALPRARQALAVVTAELVSLAGRLAQLPCRVRCVVETVRGEQNHPPRGAWGQQPAGGPPAPSNASAGFRERQDPRRRALDSLSPPAT